MFDIFTIRGDGDAAWVESTDQMEEARSRAYSLSLAFPGECFVYFERTDGASRPFGRSVETDTFDALPCNGQIASVTFVA